MNTSLCAFLQSVLGCHGAKQGVFINCRLMKRGRSDRLISALEKKKKKITPRWNRHNDNSFPFPSALLISKSMTLSPRDKSFAQSHFKKKCDYWVSSPATNTPCVMTDAQITPARGKTPDTRRPYRAEAPIVSLHDNVPDRCCRQKGSVYRK